MLLLGSRTVCTLQCMFRRLAFLVNARDFVRHRERSTFLVALFSHVDVLLLQDECSAFILLRWISQQVMMMLWLTFVHSCIVLRFLCLRTFTFVFRARRWLWGVLTMMNTLIYHHDLWSRLIRVFIIIRYTGKSIVRSRGAFGGWYGRGLSTSAMLLVIIATTLRRMILSFSTVSSCGCSARLCLLMKGALTRSTC